MKLGRNEPCHCGSGRKYKHCHYEEDRAAEAAALREASEASRPDPDDTDTKADTKADTETGTDDDSRAAARAESTGRRKKSGSRFMRDSSPGGHADGKSQTRQAGNRSARTPRGAQRGS